MALMHPEDIEVLENTAKGERKGFRFLRKATRPDMRRLMTGYAINFNLRHKRRGHLFQNRYKSIVCQEDLYLLEMTRYIHLNPPLTGLVPDLEALGCYPWAGHSALTGQVERD